MKPYIVSLAVGILIGVIYGLLRVRSPAPPLVALVGLLGILIGELVPPLVKSTFSKESALHSWRTKVRPHMFGSLPTASTTGATAEAIHNA